MRGQAQPPLTLFSLTAHPLQPSLCKALQATPGSYDSRQFPDGESYLRITTRVAGRHCLVLADLSHPNDKYLPLLFLLETLKEQGAASVGLVAPYLCYMRQDRSFIEGEAVTSRLFARALSNHCDWLVTVDPHLHRYHSLDEIYRIPSKVVQGAPALASWLKGRPDLLLVGPDAESRQWVSSIAEASGHPFVIGQKQRLGDRHVEVSLPDISGHGNKSAVIIDDVISSGQTLLQCILALKRQGMARIQCAAVHGIFADDVYAELMAAGLECLATSNTLPHPSNAIDVTPLLLKPIRQCIALLGK
ncbi:ribose-phosphate diphosphokinase [Shewanella salipaludis]|uniref:Ribose-phosphate diphosphokinase n=1 Tax=Shewanella salipaludis TaxID=2723052 RepID=A0A972FTY6_9GAMM|nr:ribose-phosphate diphosphokinase [Shewanella salipaludis]NMH65239.1 ribose-phosphate diphosphokinase [Shewanella salipaludis]